MAEYEKLGVGVLIIGAIVYLASRRKKPNESIITNPCSDAPSEFQTQCTIINTALDSKIIEWKPQTPKPIRFGVFDIFSSDNMFVKSNADIDIKFLNVLLQTHAEVIVLYVRPTQYYSQTARYNNIFNTIKNAGKKLFIGARFDDISMTSTEYNNQSRSFTTNIIPTIKPDYYGIVVEPATMEGKYGFNMTNEDWVQLVKANSDLSKQLSPNTKTAVGGHKLELDLLKALSAVISLDIIGFNIYDSAGLEPGVDSYVGYGDIVGEAIDFVNNTGKETWMLETGRTAAPTLIDQQPFMEELDFKWIKLMSYYAQKHNMSAVIPFYTGKFVSYSIDPKIYLEDLNNGYRTKLFYNFINIVSES